MRPDDPSLLIADAAVLLGVSRRTVYYWIGQRRLETVRTRGGSQRVLLSSIARRLREQRGLPPLDELEDGTPAGSETEALTFQVQPFTRDAE
jgi:excisionase family DNA binding protein